MPDGAQSSSVAPDTVTGLGPRAWLIEQIGKFKNIPPNIGRLYVFVINIPNARSVNRLYGGDAGDDYLKRVADALQNSVGKPALIGRIWGASFAVIAPLRSDARAAALAEILHTAVHSVTLSELSSVGFNARIGVISAEQVPNGTPTLLLDRAVEAAESMPKNGLRQTVFYSPKIRAAEQERRALLQAVRLRNLITRNDLSIAIQPIMQIRSTPRVARGEVLIRVDHQEDGAAPAELIKAAELFGVAVDLDTYVVDRALGWARANQDVLRHLDGISINLSATSIMDYGFMSNAVKLVTESELDPAKFTFEVTETAMIDGLERAGLLVERLRKTGAKIAIDDFGSGLCSFTYLRSLQVDEIKIDGSFVRNVASNPNMQRIVKAIQQVSAAMSKATTAECIEDAATLTALQDISIDYGQGWHFHEAMHPTAFRDLVAQQAEGTAQVLSLSDARRARASL